jgi:hypothetical protein
MKVICPNCGQLVVVHGLGRKRLNIPLKNICESLQTHRSVAAAAQELHCSEGYIFGVLKANGLRLKDVMNGARFSFRSVGICHMIKIFP